jgi:High potential iron-sulfur protein
MTERITRRAALMHCLQIPVGASVLLGLGACGNGAQRSHVTACADPSQLSEGEASMRASTHYTEASPDPQKVCAGCAFFRGAEGQGGCAPCDILHGQVNAQGHCESWSPKG